MVPSGAMARLSTALASRATTWRAPVSSATLASSPVAVSITHTLPLPSRLAAAGVSKLALITLTEPSFGSTRATLRLNHSGP